MTTAYPFTFKTFSQATGIALTAAALIATVYTGQIQAQQTGLNPLSINVSPVAPLVEAQPLSTTPASLITPDGQVLTDIPDQITLTAIPPRLGDDGILKAKPGEKIQAIVRVRNASNEAVPIKTLVRDFVIGEDGQTPIQVSSEVSNRWSLASWLTLSPESQLVQPRQTATISVLITIPQDALPGGHYAMILHEPNQNTNVQAENPVTEPQSVISQRVGTIVYFMVEGEINEEAFVRNLQVPNFTEYGPVPFTFMVENVSDVHIKPDLKLEITDMFGQTVETINLDSLNVFPYVTRSFEAKWDRVWGFGMYNARVSMSYGSQGRIAMASTSFWLLPYKLIAAAGVGLLAVLTMILLIRRHLLHRKSDQQARINMLENKINELEINRSPKQPPTDFET